MIDTNFLSIIDFFRYVSEVYKQHIRNSNARLRLDVYALRDEEAFHKL